MAMRDLAVQNHPGLPIILFGHSMGGLIALNVATAHPQSFNALTIWNSNFNPGLAGRFAQGVLYLEQMLKGSDVPSLILPKATFAAWGRAIPAIAPPSTGCRMTRRKSTPISPTRCAASTPASRCGATSSV